MPKAKKLQQIDDGVQKSEPSNTKIVLRQLWKFGLSRESRFLTHAQEILIISLYVLVSAIKMDNNRNNHSGYKNCINRNKIHILLQ